MWKKDPISMFLKCIRAHSYFLQIINSGQKSHFYSKIKPLRMNNNKKPCAFRILRVHLLKNWSSLKKLSYNKFCNTDNIHSTCPTIEIN